MGNNKDFQKDQKQQQQEQPQMAPGTRKNNEEVGEPVQLNDDKGQKQGQQNKPGMGQPREGGDKTGQQQGGGHHQEANR
jgi:hypothetical protein